MSISNLNPNQAHHSPPKLIKNGKNKTRCKALAVLLKILKIFSVQDKAVEYVNALQKTNLVSKM